MMTIGMTAARSRLRELAARTRYGGERIVLTDNGTPAAAMISPGQLAEFERLEREDIEREIAEAKMASRGPGMEFDPTLTFEEFDEAVAKYLRDNP